MLSFFLYFLEVNWFVYLLTKGESCILLEIGPLQDQLDVDIRTDVECFDSILAVRCETKNVKIQIIDQSDQKKFKFESKKIPKLFFEKL